MNSIAYRPDRAADEEPPRDSISDWANSAGIVDLKRLLEFLHKEGERRGIPLLVSLLRPTESHPGPALDSDRLVVWFMESDPDWLSLRKTLLGFARHPLTESEAAFWRKEVHTRDNRIVTMSDGATIELSGEGESPAERRGGGSGLRHHRAQRRGWFPPLSAGGGSARGAPSTKSSKEKWGLNARGLGVRCFWCFLEQF